MMKTIGLIITTFFLLCSFSPKSHAAVIINAIESGGDVIFSASGSFDLGGVSHSAIVFAVPGIAPTIDGRRVRVGGAVGGVSIDIYRSLSFVPPSGPFGTGPGFISPDSVTGDSFGIDLNSISVPAGYISGTALAGTMTFAGETFSSLGITEGTYQWTWGSGGNADSLTLNISPEPSRAFLTISGLALLVFRRRRN
ncbi:MAG: PEP-CTERM sorting domain-containing protein [Prosthecobacter sp.]